MTKTLTTTYFQQRISPLRKEPKPKLEDYLGWHKQSTKKWFVEGADIKDIKVVNICLNINLSNSTGASVEIINVNSGLEVTAVDTNEQFANPQCIYILVGPEQIMG